MLRILSRRRRTTRSYWVKRVSNWRWPRGWRAVVGKVPELLEDAELFALDLASLTAGTRYRGDFEARLKAVIDALAARKHPILCIDEVHTLVGAGAVQGGSMDAGNLLKPLLSSGRLQCIGATTWKDYRAHFEKDSELARRFQIVEVREPSHEEALKILIQGQQANLEAHHNVRYSRKRSKPRLSCPQNTCTGATYRTKPLMSDEAGAARLAKPPASGSASMTSSRRCRR